MASTPYLLTALLLAGLATADIPCPVYDVTTLRGSRIEVHSRTNAVGLRTNVTNVHGMSDYLESSKLTCPFYNTETCPGWHLNGFKRAVWNLKDNIFDDWTGIGYSNDGRYEIYDSGEGSSYKQLRFYEINEGYIYAVYHKSAERFTAYISDSRDRFPMGGLQFVLNPHQPSVVSYQEKRISYKYKSYRRNVLVEDVGDVHGTVTLSKEEPFYAVFLRREGDQICMWIKNANNSMDCLFTGGRADTYRFSVRSDNTSSFHPEPIAKRNLLTTAMQIDGTNGSATIDSVDVDASGEICLSLRYILKKDESAKVEFLADGIPQKKLHSAKLQGTGEISSHQFSMVLPETCNGEKLRITFETESAGSFTLGSSRKCSAADRDVIVQKKENVCEDFTDECRSYRNRNEQHKPFGFATKCYTGLYSTGGPNKKCHHGGVLIDGWCRCLPGFTGSACEEACPPGRFGADCEGTCVDDHECKGVSLAAPGQPLECARGFTGPGCNETCGFGFYGPDCRLKCGQCLNGTCDRFSGLCSGPCKQGYTNRTCQYQLASVDSINVLSSTFTSAEASVYVTELSDVSFKFYPFIKLLYKKAEESSSPWRNIVLPLSSMTTNFTLHHLDYGKEYIVDAALVHKSGNFYLRPMLNKYQRRFSTDCTVGAFDNVEVVAEKMQLSVTWKMTDSKRQPCYKTGYTLEVYLPELKEPIRKYAGPNETSAIVHAVFPSYGNLRLAANYTTKDTEWTYLGFSTSKTIVVSNNFEIVHETTQSIDFSWSSSNGSVEDVLICKPEPVVCADREVETKTQNVRIGKFSLQGLSPFTTYKCILQTSQLEAIAMTQEDLPRASPQPHDDPVKVTNTTASIEWKDVDCLDMNGTPKGYRIELWRGSSLIRTSTTSYATFETSFTDLTPDTSHVAKIYVVNHVGWNIAQPLSIPFKTKSTTPNAVKDLVVYKRTRNDLWLRWTPPEIFSDDTVVVAYKVTASAPGVENQTSEVPPVQCSIWPDYFCHRLRSLVPDTEYTIEVQAKNNKVDSYGPSTATKSITKEGVPDPPVNVHIQNRTANSVVLAWEVPLMLNSNPKFFAVTLEQTDEDDSAEKPTDSLDKKVILGEKQTYEVQFDQLNPATTYVVTISAGLRGQRVMFTVNTPPKHPPPPPKPTVTDISELLSIRTIISELQLTVRGIQDNSVPLNLLSGYLLLVSTNGSLSLSHGVIDKDVAASVKSQFADRFFVAQEFPPNLAEEIFTFASEPPVVGNFSLIQNTRLAPGQNYGFALAAVSTYCGAHAVTVSPVTVFP